MSVWHSLSLVKLWLNQENITKKSLSFHLSDCPWVFHSHYQCLNLGTFTPFCIPDKALKPFSLTLIFSCQSLYILHNTAKFTVPWSINMKVLTHHLKTAFTGKYFSSLKKCFRCLLIIFPCYLSMEKKFTLLDFRNKLQPVLLTELLSTFSVHLSNKHVPGCLLCADPTINLEDAKITSRHVACRLQVWHAWSKTWLEHSRNSKSTGGQTLINRLLET